MAMRVTGRTRNGGLFADRRSPQSHVLTKAPGDTVVAQWGVRNNGTTSSRAQMEIQDFASRVLAQIGPIGILPGLQATLRIDWVIPTTTPAGTVLQQNLVMFDADTRAVLGLHEFTVNVGAGGGGGGGNLAVIGDPTIT